MIRLDKFCLPGLSNFKILFSFCEIDLKLDCAIFSQSNQINNENIINMNLF